MHTLQIVTATSKPCPLCLILRGIFATAFRDQKHFGPHLKGVLLDLFGLGQTLDKASKIGPDVFCAVHNNSQKGSMELYRTLTEPASLNHYLQGLDDVTRLNTWDVEVTPGSDNLFLHSDIADFTLFAPVLFWSVSSRRIINLAACLRGLQGTRLFQLPLDTKLQKLPDSPRAEQWNQQCAGKKLTEVLSTPYAAFNLQSLLFEPVCWSDPVALAQPSVV